MYGQLTDRVRSSASRVSRRVRRAVPPGPFRLAAVSALGLGVLAGTAGLALFLGYRVAETEAFPHRYLGKIDRKLEQTFGNPNMQPAVADTTHPSHLIRLVAEVGTVETGRDPTLTAIRANGGALTALGDEVLLIAYDGRIRAATSPGDIRDTRIVAPETNREAYAALADDPDFADYTVSDGYIRYNDIELAKTPSGRVLVASYTEFHPDRACVTNTLARLDIGPEVASATEIEAGPDDWEIFYRTEPCLDLKPRFLAVEGHMAGGKLAFEPPFTIYMTNGDFHLDGMRSDGPGIAQDPDAAYGKIVAVELDSGRSRIVSSGHRNPQGIALTGDGRLYIVEHGPRGGDELNLIREGGNYGWPLESYGTTYSGARMPASLSFGRHDAFAQPVFAWLPSVATSALVEASGFHPAWDGDLIVASLIDQSLHRVRMQGDRAVYSERIEIGARIRDLHQHADGRLVLWTDNAELVFLTGVDRSNLDATLEKFVVAADLPQSTHSGLETVLGRCAECHSFEFDEHERAPGLARIAGAPIASTPFDGYSDALRDRTGHWTRDRLAAFVTDPQGFAPGTTMPPSAIDDDEVVDALVRYLEFLDAQF